jgi:hypothetical protein
MDALRDGVCAGLLSRRRFANLGSQLNDVTIGFAKELAPPDLRTYGVLQ